MLIDGKDLSKKLVQLLKKETALGLDMKKVSERYDTAKNLNDQNEFKNIDADGAKLEYRFKAFMTEKIIIMSMVINKNRNFAYN